MSNNDDNEAAFVDSFFLPGGILDPTSFEANSDEEGEIIDKNDNQGFALPVRQAKASSEQIAQSSTADNHRISNVAEPSSSQNPWGTFVNKTIDRPSNCFPAHKELGLWEQSEQYSHQGHNLSTVAINGSRLSTTNDASHWQVSEPTLLSNDLSSRLFLDTNNKGPNRLFGNELISETQQTELSEHARELLQHQAFTSTHVASAKPFTLPREASGEARLLHSTLSTSMEGQLGNLPIARRDNRETSGIPRDVDFLTNFHNVTNDLDKFSLKQKNSDKINHELNDVHNPDLRKSLPLPPPPPGFAPPPGFEQSVPDNGVLNNVVSGSNSESECNMEGIVAMPRETEQEENDSVHDEFPLEMLHTRGNDERSCTESETSSLSELTSCGEEETPSDDEDEDEEDEDNDEDEDEEELNLQRTIEDEDSSNVMAKQAYGEDLAQKNNKELKKTEVESWEQIKPAGISESPKSTLRKRRSSSVSEKPEQKIDVSEHPVGAPDTRTGREYLSDMLEKAGSTVTGYVSLLSKREAKSNTNVKHKISSKGKRKKQNKRSLESEESKRQSQKLTTPHPKDNTWVGRMSNSFLITLQAIFVAIGNRGPVFFTNLSEKMWFIIMIISKAILVAASFLFMVTKHAFFELLEENGLYTGSYVYFYMMPTVTSIMLEFWAVPHWAPHFLSCSVLFIVCREEGDNTFRKLLGRGETQNDRETISSEFGKKALFLFRCFLPVMFILDGFAQEDGFLMSLSPAARLVCGYVVSLFKVGCPLSPIGWLSCAMQILAVRYCPQTYSILDKYILIFGMATIRFIRTLTVVRKRLESLNLIKSSAS